MNAESTPETQPHTAQRIRFLKKERNAMQHYDDMPKIPTITAEEAMKLSWLASSSETMKAVRERICPSNAPSPIEVDGVYGSCLTSSALWNAGRVQGIRKERARRKRRAQTIEQ